MHLSKKEKLVKMCSAIFACCSVSTNYVSILDIEEHLKTNKNKKYINSQAGTSELRNFITSLTSIDLKSTMVDDITLAFLIVW